VKAMPAKKMRVEVFDESGNRYTITLEGKVTREKTLCLLDIIELLGGVHDKQELTTKTGRGSKFDKTKAVVEKHFPISWFSSKEALVMYERAFNEPTPLSTISTYLARMADRGFLEKQGPANNRRYRLVARIVGSSLGILGDK